MMRLSTKAQRSDVRLLFLTSLVPGDAPTTGFEIANRAIVEALRLSGAEVVVAGYARPGEGVSRPGEILLGELAVENGEAGPVQKARWLVRSLAHGLPVMAAKLKILPWKTLVARLEAAGPFDGVVLNSVQFATAYPQLLERWPAIFVAHNVEHRSAEGNANAASNAASRRLFAREATLLKAAELAIAAKARFVLTLADEDLGSLGVSHDRGAALPLTIGRPSAVPREALYDIGLIGTWSWAPNRVGLDWFLSEVVPKLPADITIAIAGRLPARKPSGDRRVSFLGRVPDAQAFVGAARVLALATRAGTGVQLKTIEALEEGHACVATPMALRGIVGPLPANVTAAAEATAFAAALARRVAEARADRLPDIDGSAFAERQRAGAARAVARALAALGKKTSASRCPPVAAAS